MKRLVTITWVSPSVFSVIFLIAFLLSCVFPSPPELRPAGHSLPQGLFAALRSHWSIASIPAFCEADEGAVVPSTRRTISLPQLRAPSGAGELLRVASSQNGSANSLTVASPLARRARIARRVGSAKAEKAASRLCITYSLYKSVFIVKQNFAPSTENHQVYALLSVSSLVNDDFC